MTDGRAVRIEVPAALAARFEEHEDFLEGLGGLEFSSAAAPDGGVSVWVDSADVPAALASLAELGAAGLLTFEEKSTDWVAESAALRKAVFVERYLFDPHDGGLATPSPPGVRRLFLPAVRAFGTGSHESTRLAVRLLLAENLAGARVLDVGCGTGTLAFVAALEGARHVVAFDLDPDAAFATRDQARANAIARVSTFAGPLEALRGTARFDVIVANMIHEEVAPLLAALHSRLAPGGRLLCSGQLVERRGEWETLLRREGFREVRSILESEWLGTAWISSNG
ncbi:MAG: 50S ribosomal protein L11 methyltransferase [Acidobacteriota bacterium]|nr:50S ribosomal protein L11 methyltransferase [Acidobacteriota bacterium]